MTGEELKNIFVSPDFRCPSCNDAFIQNDITHRHVSNNHTNTLNCFAFNDWSSSSVLSSALIFSIYTNYGIIDIYFKEAHYKSFDSRNVIIDLEQILTIKQFFKQIELCNFYS